MPGAELLPNPEQCPGDTQERLSLSRGLLPGCRVEAGHQKGQAMVRSLERLSSIPATLRSGGWTTAQELIIPPWRPSRDFLNCAVRGAPTVVKRPVCREGGTLPPRGKKLLLDLPHLTSVSIWLPHPILCYTVNSKRLLVLPWFCELF